MKVLAIGRVTVVDALQARGPIVLLEERAAVPLHLAGKIDQWNFQTAGSGVVFVKNVTSTAEAGPEALPLGQVGMVEFQFVPLGPLKPLGLFLAGGPREFPLEGLGHAFARAVGSAETWSASVFSRGEAVVLRSRKTIQPCRKGLRRLP